VRVGGIYARPSQEQARLPAVRFAPCAVTHWHAHRPGQTLHVLDGTPHPDPLNTCQRRTNS
jgi:quercetin dioxygenase-like cupin family protein